MAWALQKLKMKAAAGKDGIPAKMMNRDVLVVNGNCLIGAGGVVWKSIAWWSQCQRQEARKHAGQKSSMAYLWSQWCTRQCV